MGVCVRQEALEGNGPTWPRHATWADAVYTIRQRDGKGADKIPAKLRNRSESSTANLKQLRRGGRVKRKKGVLEAKEEDVLAARRKAGQWRAKAEALRVEHRSQLERGSAAIEHQHRLDV
eukprot:6173869-Pleurochrysis_carterae.AAC.6